MKFNYKFIIIFLFFFSTNPILADNNLASFLIRDYDLGALPVVGSEEAEFTIVEFFDYRCGYCRKQAIDFSKLLNENSNVQVVYLEFPIFGGISETAASVALYVWKIRPDLYFDIHNGLMSLGPAMKKENVIKLLDNIGLDGKSIFEMAENDKENIIINKNKVLAKSLGLRGTPALIINDTIMPGYVKIDNLRSMIKQ